MFADINPPAIIFAAYFAFNLVATIDACFDETFLKQTNTLYLRTLNLTACLLFGFVIFIVVVVRKLLKGI